MDLQSFLKENAVQAEYVDYVVSSRFKDSEGKPIPWKLKILDQKEDEELRRKCTKKAFNPGTKDVTMHLDSDLYGTKLICASVVEPNLNDAQLQQSYGAVGAEDLIRKMLIPGEYSDLVLAIMEANGHDMGMSDKINLVKN